MRFTTVSGAVYDLFNTENGVEYIARDCKVPVVDFMSGNELPEITATRVEYDRPPTVGEPFWYVTASHGQCRSTPVVSIEIV